MRPVEREKSAAAAPAPPSVGATLGLPLASLPWHDEQPSTNSDRPRSICWRWAALVGGGAGFGLTLVPFCAVAGPTAKPYTAPAPHTTARTPMVARARGELRRGRLTDKPPPRAGGVPRAPWPAT